VLVQWFSTAATDLISLLNSNLLRQDKAECGFLHVNLAPALLLALEEAYVFERQWLGVPAAAASLLPERLRLRATWIGACAVSRAYNMLLGSLTIEERRLCKDRVRYSCTILLYKPLQR
jgi:hypothetical protein